MTFSIFFHIRIICHIPRPKMHYQSTYGGLKPPTSALSHSATQVGPNYTMFCLYHIKPCSINNNIRNKFFIFILIYFHVLDLLQRERQLIRPQQKKFGLLFFKSPPLINGSLLDLLQRIIYNFTQLFIQSNSFFCVFHSAILLVFPWLSLEDNKIFEGHYGLTDKKIRVVSVQDIRWYVYFTTMLLYYVCVTFVTQDVGKVRIHLKIS